MITYERMTVVVERGEPRKGMPAAVDPAALGARVKALREKVP